MADDELDAAGPQYRVTQVAGHRPTGIDDFVGATTVTVEGHGHESRLIGAGTKDDHTVLFHQKEAGSATDVEPVWTFTDSGDGDITATPPTVV